MIFNKDDVLHITHAVDDPRLSYEVIARIDSIGKTINSSNLTALRMIDVEIIIDTEGDPSDEEWTLYLHDIYFAKNYYVKQLGNISQYPEWLV